MRLLVHGGRPWAFDSGKSCGFFPRWHAQPKSLSPMGFWGTQHRLLALCTSVLERFEILGALDVHPGLGPASLAPSTR